MRACIVNFHTSLGDIEALPPLLSRFGGETDAAEAERTGVIRSRELGAALRQLVRSLRVTMDLGHAESADGVTLEVEFDQHHGLPAHNPTVMTRVDRHDLGGLVFDDAAVGVLDVDFAARQKTHVGVHTQVSPDDGFM